MGRGEGKPQNSLGHPFLSHTLKPRWQRLKAEGAKSHLQTLGSPWVWTGKQGELRSRISIGNKKNTQHGQHFRAILYTCTSAVSCLFKGRSRLSRCCKEQPAGTVPWISTGRAHRAETPLWEEGLELTFFECFSEALNILTSTTRELM